MTMRPDGTDLQMIGSEIANCAPEGWTAAHLTYETVGPTGSRRLEVDTPDGRIQVLGRLSFDALDRLDDLRAAMYRPGAGTWFTARFSVFADGRITTDFDYDNEPTYDFAPNSWIADAENFPRTPENTPAWLTAKVEQPDWVGARWQLEFTADGAALDNSAPLDATTTEQGHAWCAQIAQQLRERGHDVTQGVDDGEDGRGNPVQYDELTLTLRSGYMGLAFFRDEVFWTTEVWPHEVDQTTFTTLARDVLTVVRETTGYDIGDQPAAYDRKLLGLTP